MSPGPRCLHREDAHHSLVVSSVRFVVGCGDCCCELLDTDRCADRRAGSSDDGSRETVPFVSEFCRLFTCQEWSNHVLEIWHCRGKPFGVLLPVLIPSCGSRLDRSPSVIPSRRTLGTQYSWWRNVQVLLLSPMNTANAFLVVNRRVFLGVNRVPDRAKRSNKQFLPDNATG